MPQNSFNAPVLDAAITPNGNLLAYADTSGLNLKVISSGEVHTLFTPPAWNPPGRYRLPTDVTWRFTKPRFTENAWLLENF